MSEVSTKLQKIHEESLSLVEECKDQIDKKFKRERVRMGMQSPTGDILAAEHSANLRKMLVMKADKMDVERLYELKSNKLDTDTMINQQRTISKQFQHILSLFIELLTMS